MDRSPANDTETPTARRPKRRARKPVLEISPVSAATQVDRVRVVLVGTGGESGTCTFVISRRLLAHLDKTNPCLGSGTAAIVRWKSSVVLRTPPRQEDWARLPEHGVGTHANDDARFLYTMLRGFAEEIHAHTELLARIGAMEQRVPALRACLAAMRRRCLRGQDPIMLPRGDSRPPTGCHPRPLASWTVWALTPALPDDDGTLAPEHTGEEEDVPTLWRQVLTYDQDDRTGSDRACGVLPDELRPLWYLILAEQGYATESPCQRELADSLCLPDLLVLHPAQVGPFADGLNREIQEEVRISPGTFVGMMERLGLLATVKLRAMQACLEKRAPSLAVLIHAGFRAEILGLAQDHRSRTIATQGLQEALDALPESRPIRFMGKRTTSNNKKSLL